MRPRERPSWRRWAGASAWWFSNPFTSGVEATHRTGTPEGYRRPYARALEAMTPEAMLINAARGSLIDEDALLHALDTGALAGAALDVLADEPPAADHPLLLRRCVPATPHVSGFTHESSFRESSWALDHAACVLDRLEPMHT